MNDQLPANETRKFADLVAAVERALAGSRKPSIPKSFVEDLFARAMPEDMGRYTPNEIAVLVDGAWTFLADRKEGSPKLRLMQPEPLGEELEQISILEIVNDDMPFLVDSVLGELAEQGVEIRLVVHPIFAVKRDRAGHLADFHGSKPFAGARRESFIHVHLDRIEDEQRRANIVDAISQTLADVRVCVTDWRPMMDRVQEVIVQLETNPPPLPSSEIAEAIQLLNWLVAENFVFLGVRSHVFTEGRQRIEPCPETGLGLLRSPQIGVLGRSQVVITPEIRKLLDEPVLLVVNKSGLRSRVHRRAYMDYVGVKQYGTDGNLIGEFRILGLFTSTVYTRSVHSIPYIRQKAEAVMARAGFNAESHSGKALANVLETYPRDELFQIDPDTLYEFAIAILQLEERPRVRVLPRCDRFDRFVSVLVFTPRDRYNSEIRRRIGEYLARIYQGHVTAFFPFFPEGALARVQFVIGTDGAPSDPDRRSLEAAVNAIVRTWSDALLDSLIAANGPATGHLLFERYRGAFSEGYREAYSAADAVNGIRIIENLSPNRPLSAEFQPHGSEQDGAVTLKIWNHGRPIPLSERVPVLENMGFKVIDELTYRIGCASACEADVWLHDMTLVCTAGEATKVVDRKQALETCFIVVMTGGAENDGYNALVLAAGLMWRDVALLRTLSRFLRQARVPYSQGYMASTLVKHAELAARLAELFHHRFDPRLGASPADTRSRQTEMLEAIEAALARVESLDEDRILRHFVNVVAAALRTNFYQLGNDGGPKHEIAIKFASRQIESLPLPRPLYEIFVYSPRFEGVHLRFGKIARGGIRWSDRPQDFRTEILGLAKAQQVKNAVIVPVGAKGGFVPKRLPLASGGSRDAVQAEGTATYKLFISTLLDLTDNLSGKGVEPPTDVMRHDDDDPYLVVAADKGTATFSDIANEISIAHRFWLGDAFASGGSAGYDHKKIGITARGAWESVKRHFREMDIDIGKTPFTVAGIGDMSGDVFGNGMLREKTIRLVAAFDHRDIFIDPDPDSERSFTERMRLFELPRSSWQDYDRSRISKGGGVYSRALKEITLALEAQQALGFSRAKTTPHELMRAILEAPVDLLFFGGIGTFVRASTETDEAAADRANDAIRITGGELRCKVIGEGANLGMTQRGRIEAAFRGIRLNTDAIDNSAGVNTSDLEVNIKIAIAAPVRSGQLSLEERNLLLEAMTDEVAALVLRNNYQQPLALSLAERRGLEDLGFEQRLMQKLESAGDLDRAVEFLPDDKEIAERARRFQAFTRPELSVLLAYAKLALQRDLIESDVPDDPYLARELGRYFPNAVVERFPDAVEQHRLRREIIATQLANSMINRGGPSLLVRITDQTGASAARIAAVFALARDSYQMTALNAEIDALDGQIAGKLQLELYAAVQDLLLDRLVWFVRNADLGAGLAPVVEHYRNGIAAVAAALDHTLSVVAAKARASRAAELAAAGVPQTLAVTMASLPALTSAPDITMVADRTGAPISEVMATYFAAESYFGLDRITRAARDIKVADYFDRLALDRALDAIGDVERRLTAAMSGTGVAGIAAVERWVAARKGDADRIRASIEDIANTGLSLAKLSLIASLLSDLVK
jgi:glutamate dehydrogenase